MDIKEAIQEIDALVHAAMREYNIKDEENAYDEEVLDVAVRAMKKQIPMKPELRPLPMSMCVEYTNANYCPNCGERLLSEDLHCPDCGQKLKWED